MHKKFITHLTIFGLLFLLFASWLPGNRTQAASNDLTCYVKWNASGSNNGTSWTDAYSGLTGVQTALDNANCTQIWVSSGTYWPTNGSDRTATFELKNGVALYGGFSGVETSLNERDLIANETYLSGNINNISIHTDNSYHVVTGISINNTAVLDGFTISNGRADASSGDNRLGAGMFISSGTPTVRNVTFKNNYAVYGGGLFIEENSTVSLWGINFDSNTATAFGAGLYSHTSNYDMGNVTFIDNDANSGGGAIFNINSNPTLTNLTIMNNSTAGAMGGGIYNNDSNSEIINTIFWGNTANTSATSNYQIYDNSGSTTAIRDSVVEYGFSGGTNIITEDPMLADALDNYGGRMLAVPIRYDSSARDAASLDDCPYVDQRGLNRPQGAGCDIGAYEFQDVIYVVPGGRTSGFCQSWSFGCDLQYVLNDTLDDNWIWYDIGKQVWVKEGIYTPTTSSDRSASFLIGYGEQIFGGFAGTETALQQRDYQNNITILSGEINTAAITDNSYHVVAVNSCYWNFNSDTGTLIDGFTISRGYANGGGDDSNGGGILSDGCALFRNVIIRNNYASGSGGGIWSGYNMDIETTTIASNQAAIFGGGMYIDSNANADLTNVRLIQNSSASSGGGIYNLGNSNLIDVTFTQNSAPSDAGGMSTQGSAELSDVIFDRNTTKGKGGGLLFVGLGNLTLTDVTFVQNQAVDDANQDGSGGGMSVTYYGPSPPQLSNLTFDNNQADDRGGGLDYYANNQNYVSLMENATFVGNTAKKGGGMYFNGATGTMNSLTMKDNVSTLNQGPSLYYDQGYLEIENSIFWSESPYEQIYNFTTDDVAYVSNSVVKNGYLDGTNIITDDPLLGSLGDYGGSTQTIRLQVSSPAIDAANDAYCPTTDQRGVTRPKGAHCDIGAYEAQIFNLNVNLVGTGSGNVSGDGINCGSDCSELFIEGSQVTLTASAETGSVFAGWSGACTGTGTCQVSMSQARSVTATFVPVPPGEHSLTVSLAGSGSGSVSGSGIDCFVGAGADCTETYNEGTLVTLTAIPGSSSTFTGWSGDCSGAGTCQVTMNAAKSVSASFDSDEDAQIIFLPMVIK